MKLPEQGITQKEILKKLDDYKKNDLNWQSGKAFGYIFDPGKEVLFLYLL